MFDCHMRATAIVLFGAQVACFDHRQAAILVPTDHRAMACLNACRQHVERSDRWMVACVATCPSGLTMRGTCDGNSSCVESSTFNAGKTALLIGIPTALFGLGVLGLYVIAEVIGPP